MADPAILLAHIAFNVAFGVCSWLIGLAASAVLCASIVVFRPAARWIQGFCASFGMLPFLLVPPILATIGQPEVALTPTLRIYPAESLLIAAACLFPIVEETSAALAVVDRRYQSLSKLANLTPIQRLLNLAAPYLVIALLVGACATLPLAVLLAVIFEWSRGGDDGIGRYMQGVISTGSTSARLLLVLEVGAVTGAIYGAVDYLRQRLARRLSVSHDTQADGGPVLEYRRSAQVSAEFFLGLTCGLVVYACAWLVLFKLRVLDPSIEITPDKLAARVVAAVTATASTPDKAIVMQALSAGLHTGSSALMAALIGIVASAGAAIIADKCRLWRTAITITSSITQAVPIFVLIPFYVVVLRSPALVATMVMVSVTFFASYQVFFSKLQAIPPSWQDLLSATVVQGHRGFLRQFRYWYLPLVWHYGSTALTVVAPSAFAAALITEFFLAGGQEGLGYMFVNQVRTDTFAQLLIVNISLLIILILFVLSRISLNRKFG